MTFPTFAATYRAKRVLITGHTGFKGSWLTLWLTHLGADVYGFSLPPPTKPSLFELLKLKENIHQEEGDIRDPEALQRCVERVKPEIIFHLAAQSLVRESYLIPYETVAINALGSVNLLEAVRKSGISTTVIMVTSDKCYDNREWLFGYRENDPLGGYDPYSASKGAAEVLISSWRNSFFHPHFIQHHGVKIASVRAGNVIGGGDWSKDRIVPDSIRDLVEKQVIEVRNPFATRPWQHVLEPLSGYMQLGAKLLSSNAEEAEGFCEPFNFGPSIGSNRSVKELVDKIVECWGSGSWKWIAPERAPHESGLLNLTIDKSYHKLQWMPKWDFDTTIVNTIAWYRTALQEPSMIPDFTLQQINQYQDGTALPVEDASTYQNYQ